MALNKHKEIYMSAMDKLLAAVNKAKQRGGSERNEDTFYYPVRDAAGNGQATIRFLPGKTEDDIPFVKIYSHGFQGPTGKWLIDECPTTIDKPCYVCEQNGILWNTNIKANQDIVRERKRKVSYIANILVVEDKKTPENEGKIFLFKFGSKIFDKIFNAISPDDEDETPCNVFDLVSGANFKFKIRKVEKQTNYDKSEFMEPSECSLSKDDLDKLEDLSKFLAPEKFKSEEELKRRFNAAVGNTDRLAAKDQGEDSEPVVTEPRKPKAAPKDEEERVTPADEGDDDIEALMRRLAEEA